MPGRVDAHHNALDTSDQADTHARVRRRVCLWCRGDTLFDRNTVRPSSQIDRRRYNASLFAMLIAISLHGQVTWRAVAERGHKWCMANAHLY